MTEPLKPPPNAALLLADGTVFFGYGVGASGVTAGEICFNTAMTGYQEILTDPSYTGQIITFTFPHIGNVGTNIEDIETEKPTVAGLILREPITAPSNFRATHHLHRWLATQGITGICGIDTRALTRHIRLKGAQNCAIVVDVHADTDALLKRAKKSLEAAPDMNGLELAAHVTTKKNHAWNRQRWELGKGYAELRGTEKNLPHVVAIDYGCKQNILRSLASVGCRITVVPATVSEKDVLALKPDGVFLSNGPGDPAATGHYAVPVIKKLIATGLPVFGICLGHQMLGIALGCRTIKMNQGHRGANHPVKDQQTGKVEITSQNHGFAISDQALPAEVEVTHRSLFDGTIQGIRLKDKPVFSVQGHPEASPGPHDSQYLFQQFVEMMGKKKEGGVMSTQAKIAIMFMAAFCFSSEASATTDGYFQFYMPAYTWASDADTELTVLPGTFTTAGSMPETAIAAALYPYYVHAVGYGSDPKRAKEGHNINPASSMHLEINMDAYPEEKCSIMLDITHMTLPSSEEFPDFKRALTNKEITLTQVLEQVVIALEKNITESGYDHSCSFSVKGLDKHPEVKADIKPGSPLLKTVLKGGPRATPL